jgi:negative regulator of flagellin synthesis FlgM
MESEFAMTDPISNNRPTGPAGLPRASTDKAARKPDSLFVPKDDSAPSAVDTTRNAAGADEVVLSNVMQRAQDASGFDQAKVDSIKKAIKDGQYPLDPRRIAESFNALEKMIRG